MQDRQGRTAHAYEIGNATVVLCSPRLSLVNAHNLVCDKYVGASADPLNLLISQYVLIACSCVAGSLRIQIPFERKDDS